MQNGFQFVETIGTLAEDVEEEVDLAGGMRVKRHGEWRGAAKPPAASSGGSKTPGY
jgi:hypothetical protein